MIKLSVVIITLNEEKNIGRCIESVKAVADEILVVDSLSTDKTRAISEFHGARFVEQKFLGYVEQKNFALRLASYDYVLSLDADEALDEKLKQEILKLKENFTLDGYAFNRLTSYNGFWVKHCGWYPDTKLRLVKKDKAVWVGNNPHDALTVKGSEGYIAGDLLHYSYDSISAHVLQTNKFSTIEAQSLFNKGKRVNLWKLVTRPPMQFFKDYILRKGFLDGRYGFIICFINSLYVLLKYAKMMDMQLNKKI
ncbi:MAG: glycosyltransferase family 2 protein [Bdellovibrionales bacterium]|nr:glycosyltransferase family 2 protein [Bdellovibrionales bacterium]